jgi:hypothetical protein
MIRLRLILLVVIWPICATPVQAQLFRKKPAAPAAQRVPELVLMLKADPDERKRAGAAEELREFDIQTYTEILPVLIDAAKNDPKLNVRLEALTTLSKLRPINQEAGQALERAAADDVHLRVRIHARTTLWKYQLAGYSSGGAKGKRKTTEEPPLIEPPVLLPPTDTAPEIAPVRTPPDAGKSVDLPRPLPSGPSFSTAVPQTPKLVTRPAAEPTIVEDELPPLPPATPMTPPPAVAPPVIAPPPVIVPPPAGPSPSPPSLPAPLPAPPLPM